MATLLPISADEDNIHHLSICMKHWCQQCEDLAVSYDSCDICYEMYHVDSKKLIRNSEGEVLCPECSAP